MPATNPNWTGLDMYLYLNTATQASPTWVLIDNCDDLKRSKSRAEADLSSRKSDEMQREPTLADVAFSWGMIIDETDSNYTTLRTNEEGRVLTELAFANQPIATSGCVYVRRQLKIFGLDEDYPLKDGVKSQLTAKPCKGAIKSRVTVP
jgi:hypothetical protein